MVKVFIVVLLALFATAYSAAVPEETDVSGNAIDITDGDDEIDLSQFGTRIFGTPDAETGDVIDKLGPDSPINPEEAGNYVEGDMLIPRPAGRNGLIAQSARWPAGIVPFEIKGDFNAREMSIIEQALDDYRTLTCVRFVPRLSETDYISIVSDRTGCWSSVGRIGGRQEVNLQNPGCLSRKGTVIHELMHALGFFHEQNRAERDNHVRIMWNNILNGREVNFEKGSETSISGLGVPYDYGSVMHYSANSFSKNKNNPTIVPIEKGVEIGQREGLSRGDIKKIRLMYNCSR